jgi:hypothetical protein
MFACVVKYANNIFPLLRLKKLIFIDKSSDSIFFLLGLSPIVNLFNIKNNLFKPFTWKILFNLFRNGKET